MQFSDFGEKFTRPSGITQLMDDLDQGIRAGDDVVMLGGGNPAHIPQLHDLYKMHLQRALDDGSLMHNLSNYDGPQGNQRFINSLAEFFQSQYGWPITSENIALTNGSQNAFFYLFNLFAGQFGNQKKRVLFPLVPEYIGYEDSGLSEDHFVAVRPNIELVGEREFKYHIDFDALEITDDIGLVCVSRPTNPSGNVLTDAEVAKLDQMARDKNVPLLIDNAYGVPFPNIQFTGATPFWNDNTILCLSLSKLGLPGARCGIVVAKPDVIQAIGNLSGIISLAPGGIGPTIATRMLADASLGIVSNEIIQPFYKKKSEFARQQLLEKIRSPKFRIHKSEGAIFLWLWFEGLSIDDRELYERLKKKGLLIVPGSYFFPGIVKTWKHTRECVRLNFSQSQRDVVRGIDLLAAEVNPLLSS
jgi:valine--pyruvate aminotransferase